MELIVEVTENNTESTNMDKSLKSRQGSQYAPYQEVL